MKRFLIALIALAFVATPAFAITEQRTKNVATYVTFPIYKNDGTLISGATGLDTECDFYANGTAPDGFADATNEATEIGSTGFYYLSLSQSEMNNDIIVCQVKSSSTGAVVTPIHITTLAAPANIVSANASSIEAGDFAADGTAQAGTASTIQLASAETYGDNQIRDNCVSILSGTGKGQQRLITAYTGSTDTATVTPDWDVVPSSDSTYAIGGCARVPGVTGTVVGDISGAVGSVTGNVGGSCDSVTNPVTVGTNNDKTGYGLSQAFPTNFSALDITAGGVVSAALGATPSCTLEDDAITAAKITEAAAEMLADYVLRRGSANIETSTYGDALARKSLYGVIAQQTHRTKNEGGQLKLYKADGTTVLSTRTATGQAGANPIVELGD